MIIKQLYTQLQSSMSSREEADRKTIYYITDTVTDKSLKDTLINIVYDDLECNNDIAYSILNSAINVFDDIDYEDIPSSQDDFDTYLYKNEDEYASYYTATRLSYLDVNNENDIAAIIKDYEFQSISEAAAYWYDDQVRNTLYTLYDFIINQSK